jgi:hypothetical protein
MKSIVLTLMIAAVAAPSVAAAGDGSTTEFAGISGHYEAIRQALMKDGTAAVSDHARSIRDLVSALRHDFTPTAAGVPSADSDRVRQLLPEVEQRAADLAAASGLDDVRAAFAELTKPLVRWQSMVAGNRPVVVYCPMEKRSWLQPDEPIGNPYAPSMLRCGEVVAR